MNNYFVKKIGLMIVYIIFFNLIYRKNFNYVHLLVFSYVHFSSYTFKIILIKTIQTSLFNQFCIIVSKNKSILL